MMSADQPYAAATAASSAACASASHSDRRAVDHPRLVAPRFERSVVCRSRPAGPAGSRRRESSWSQRARPVSGLFAGGGEILR